MAHSPHHKSDVHIHEQSSARDYAILFGLLVSIFILAWIIEFFSIGTFEWKEVMRMFMAFFFLVFGTFKLIDTATFVSAFREYDIVAKKYDWYASKYPYIELALGFSYVLKIALPVVNVLTLILMAIGAVGVTRELRQKRKIRCACLGAVVRLPLTTVSLLEDVGMGVMALGMLFI